MPQDSAYYYIHVPCIEMRAQPSIKSEVVSQALFSERILPIAENADWIKIETIVDEYQGWISKEGVHFRKTPYIAAPQNLVAHVNRCAAHLYDVEDTIYGPAMTLPFESRLEIVEPMELEKRWIKVSLPDKKKKFIQRGDVAINPLLLKRKEMLALSTRFLGLPYTWGGRSSFGYDCSGFVQMLYRMMGIYLPRDAQEQFHWDGFKDVEISLMRPGDLIFFGMGPDHIRHVGMFLGNGTFIHTSGTGENAPYLRISRLKDKVWNSSGCYPYRAARACAIKMKSEDGC
jgi:hypothetical protein